MGMNERLHFFPSQFYSPKIVYDCASKYVNGQKKRSTSLILFAMRGCDIVILEFFFVLFWLCSSHD